MANPITKKPKSKNFSKKSKSSKKLAKKALLNKEFNNLKSLIPTLTNKSNVRQVTILEETLRLISSLENRLINKMSQETEHKPMNKLILQELIMNQFLSTKQVDMDE